MPSRLPPPASCPSDCKVGPTPEELSDPSTFVHWGYNDRYHHEHSNGRKRKHPEEECGGIHREAATSSTVTSLSTPSSIPSTTSARQIPGSSFQHAIDTFLSSGCCAIEDPVCLPPDFVRTCLDRARKDHRFLEGLMRKEREAILGDVLGDNDQTSSNHHHRLAALTRQDYAEWVARDGGRVDVRYRLHEHPYNCGGLIYNSLVFPLVRALLNGRDPKRGNRDDGDGDGIGNGNGNGNADDDADDEHHEPIQLLYAGIMWGMPIGTDHNDNGKDNGKDNDECHHQHWHADGGHHFGEHQLPPGLTLPPHCINVFYPLVDLTEDNGPTEFRIGSHRNDFDAELEFPLLCPAGGAVLFDYRIQHRGRANRIARNGKSCGEHGNANGNGNGNGNSENGNANGNGNGTAEAGDHRRPVLYLAYAKTYFKDHGNTRSGRRLDPSSSSKPWTTRTLEGNPVPYGKGFDRYESSSSSSSSKRKRNGIQNGNCDDQRTPAGPYPGEPENDNDNNKNDETKSALPTTAATEFGDAPTTANTASTSTASTTTNEWVGERWVLFQMTLELPDGSSKILKVHKGDVAVEVAEQFCFRHRLQDDFVEVLAQTIQAQMDQCVAPLAGADAASG